MRFFKRYFITGLLIWIPLVITVWVLVLLISALESVVPEFLSPQALFGIEIPGFRVVLILLVVWLSGFLAANFIGQTLIDAWERTLGHIPLVRSIYNSVKQVSDTVLAPDGRAFRDAVLVQYPRAGAWTIAFITGKPSGEVAQKLGDDYVSIYVPTTPNPTSGFFLMVPRADIHALDMSVDEALKYIVSMGVVTPLALGVGRDGSRLPASVHVLRDGPPLTSQDIGGKPGPSSKITDGPGKRQS